MPPSRWPVTMAGYSFQVTVRAPNSAWPIVQSKVAAASTMARRVRATQAAMNVTRFSVSTAPAKYRCSISIQAFFSVTGPAGAIASAAAMCRAAATGLDVA